jgi:soluble lytic murein transglycosylase-like protein
VAAPKAVAVTSISATAVVPRAIAPVPVPAATPESAPAAGVLNRTVDEIAARHSLPPQLLHSVIKVESNYNPLAVSPKGALGLMQLIPATARRFGVDNVFNPSENISGGARYLRYLLDLYHNDYRLALAAYNAGEGAVARYGGVPPYAETQNYVALVGKQLEARLQQPASPAANEVKPAQPEAAGVPHIQQIVEPDGSVRYVSR